MDGHEMLQEFVAIVGIMTLTSVTHLLGLLAMEPACKRFIGRGRRHHHGAFMLVLALMLMGLHTLEIVEYALLYWKIGALPGYETALYFSGDAYSTIGGLDIYLPHRWRLIGSFEGVNGMVLIGWSTAFLFAAWRDILRADPAD